MGHAHLVLVLRNYDWLNFEGNNRVQIPSQTADYYFASFIHPFSIHHTKRNGHNRKGAAGACLRPCPIFQYVACFALIFRVNSQSSFLLAKHPHLQPTISDQIRPDPTRADQTRPDPTRPDQSLKNWYVRRCLVQTGTGHARCCLNR